MDFILSQFDHFNYVSYITLVLTLICLLITFGADKNDPEPSPVWPLIISNISFWFFLKYIPGDTDIYVKVIGFVSIACLCWFFIIRVDEKENNADRKAVGRGKDSVKNGYENAKQKVKNKASESVGGGFMGELLGAAVDIGSQKAGNKLFGFLDMFESGPYTHPSRGKIYSLTNLTIFAILVLMFWL